MKIKTDNKILKISLFMIVVISIIVITLVLFLGGILTNNKNDNNISFKHNIIVENINQKINIKDLLTNKDFNSNSILIQSKNENVVCVENSFISLNAKGISEISIEIKHNNKTYKDITTIVVVEDKNNNEELMKYISLESLIDTTYMINEKIDFSILGEMSGFVDVSLSNSIATYNKEEKKLITTNEGKTTITLALSYQTLNSLKPINICSYVDLFIESKIDDFDVLVLDREYNETSVINYVSTEDDVCGYLMIEDIKFLSIENLQTDFGFCSFYEPIIKDNKFLIPFKLNDWGVVEGSVVYNGKQGEFACDVSFTAFNETYKTLPTDIELIVNKNSNVVSCGVVIRFEEKVSYLPFSVFFIKDGVETEYKDTTYITNFEIDANTILFKTEETDFYIKVVLKNIPTMMEIVEIS